MDKRRTVLHTVCCVAVLTLAPQLLSACNTAPEMPPLPTLATMPSATPTVTPIPEVTTALTVTPTTAPAATTTPTVTPTTAPTATATPTVAPKEPIGEVTVPRFSGEGGFYDSAFSLTLSCDSDCEIYYTLDGSDPRTSGTALLYRAAISIYNNTNEPNRLSSIAEITLGDYTPPDAPVDKGIVVRAASKDGNGIFSEVVTNSYFVEKNASYYTDMKVLSLVTDSANLFDPNNGAYMIGTGYYVWRNSDEYVYYDSGDSRNPTNYNKDGRESEFPVHIQIFENGKAQYNANVGARISGNWSRSEPQKSIRLYARSEYGEKKMNYPLFGNDLIDTSGNLIEKFDKVTLRNGGNDARFLHFRDALIQDLASGLAVDVMASEPYILFINGEFWGFYLLREKTDGDYIESHYGIPEETVTVIKNGGLESGSGDSLVDFREFSDWAKSADMTVDANYKRFCDTIDLQSFMDYMTVETYVCNNDWANGGLNNWMVWRADTPDASIPKADGKWRYIFYDLDMAAGLYGSAQTSAKYDCLGSIHAPDSSNSYPEILRNLIRNDTFRQAFCDNYLRIIDTVFATNLTDAKIDAYVAAYMDATLDTFHRFDSSWSAHGYLDGIAALKNFFHLRPTYAKKYLEKYCNINDTSDDTSSEVTKNFVPDVTDWSYYGPAEVSANSDDGSFQVSVPKPCDNVWSIQSQAGPITLEAYKEYELTFSASCSVPCEFAIGINHQVGNDYPTCFWVNANLTENLTEYTYRFTADSETYYDWRLCFNFGNSSGVYIVKDVLLTEVN